MRRLPLGCLLLALAAASWVLLALVDGNPRMALDLLPVLAGTALAAWGLRAQRLPLAAIGLVVAALGMAWFYRGDFLAGLFSIAGALYAAGCVVAGVALLRRHDATLAGGFLLVALAGLLWVASDGVDGWRWQAGNLLTLAGGVVAALGARRVTPR